MKRRNLVPRHVYSKKAWYITRSCRQLLQRSVSVIAKMKEVERYCKIVRWTVDGVAGISQQRKEAIAAIIASNSGKWVLSNHKA